MIGSIETDDSMDIDKDFVKWLDVVRMCIKKANNEPFKWRIIIDIFLDEKIDFFDKSKIKVFFIHNFPIFGKILNLKLWP